MANTLLLLLAWSCLLGLTPLEQDVMEKVNEMTDSAGSGG